MSKKNASRRKFIRNTSVAAAGFYIVPRHVLGRGYVAPSDKLRIAGIGVGGKGENDLAEFAKSPRVSIVALCDVDDRQAVKSRTSFPKAPYYRDYREMLEKEKNNIDAVSLLKGLYQSTHNDAKFNEFKAKEAALKAKSK